MTIQKYEVMYLDNGRYEKLVFVYNKVKAISFSKTKPDSIVIDCKTNKTIFENKQKANR